MAVTAMDNRWWPAGSGQVFCCVWRTFLCPSAVRPLMTHLDGENDRIVEVRGRVKVKGYHQTVQSRRRERRTLVICQMRWREVR